jgi:hypothetical protein
VIIKYTSEVEMEEVANRAMSNNSDRHLNPRGKRGQAA